MWSPPHLSDLHPIELVWANFKVTVRRQYTTSKTLVDVKSRLKYAFAILNTKIVAVCIKQANNTLAELFDQIMLMEVIEEDEQTTENNHDESDNDSLGGW